MSNESLPWSQFCLPTKTKDRWRIWLWTSCQRQAVLRARPVTWLPGQKRNIGKTEKLASILPSVTTDTTHTPPRRPVPCRDTSTECWLRWPTNRCRKFASRALSLSGSRDCQSAAPGGTRDCCAGGRSGGLPWKKRIGTARRRQASGLRVYSRTPVSGRTPRCVARAGSRDRQCRVR